MNDADRKAMQQALDALDGGLSNDPEELAELIKKHDKAIADLRTQLAAPEPFQPDWANYRSGFEHGAAEALEVAAKVCDIGAAFAESSGRPTPAIMAHQVDSNAIRAIDPATIGKDKE